MSSRSRIYVGNISSRIHERDLDDLFYKAGRIHSIEIKKGGFGFIEFTNPDDAHEAVRRYNGRELDGKALRVETSIGHTRSRPLSSSGFAFEVTGVAPNSNREMTWRDLKDWARDTAEVTYTKVLTPTIGYIEVASRRDLDSALAKLDNTTFMGSTVRVKSVDCLFRPTIDPETRERIRDDGRDDRRGGRDRRGGHDRRDDRRRGSSPRRRDRRSPSPRRDSRNNRSPIRDHSRDRNYRGDNRSPPRSPIVSPRAADRDDYQMEHQDVPFGNADSSLVALPVYDADDALRDAPTDL